LNRGEIEQCIPHRAPFLWLDEVISFNESRLHARKYLDPDLDVFSGHYPGHPVLPGVLLCEMAFQAAAVLIAKLDSVSVGTVPVATRIGNTQFRRMVRPGDTVDIEVELREHLANAFFLNGKLSVKEKLAARLEFACALAPSPSV
jgi:3-hydroxyacyl-[acyl-carrier-protein] dehydratase